jgi:hypothetical protein
MLTTYVTTPLALEQYRSGPAGPHLDAFIGWLEEHGYQHRRIPHLIRGVKRSRSGREMLGCLLSNSMQTHSKRFINISKTSDAFAMLAAAVAIFL